MADSETVPSLLDVALLEVSQALTPLAEVDSAAKATALMKLVGYELPGTQTFDAIPPSLMGKVGGIGEHIVALVDGATEDARLAAARHCTHRWSPTSPASSSIWWITAPRQ